ncbi:hypothetical protein ACWX0K_15020 [Nitrobacteraceae bacterium UC4446_H13]
MAKMHNPETGKTADVHPDEVANWKAVGWRESEVKAAAPLPPPPAPAAKPQLGLPKNKA